MANVRYTTQEALQLVLAEDGVEYTDSDEDIVADIEDDDGNQVVLSQSRVEAHERETLLFLDNEINSVSTLVLQQCKHVFICFIH